jgi:tRNA threonylcarbamoyl adenosine modification protein YeaZ
MHILALEFSSIERSVAVHLSDGQGGVRGFVQVIEGPSQPHQPLQMIETALRSAKIERQEIECVAVGLGPGSYTGIRAAIALAQGWQLARGTKLLGISSAECIALTADARGVARKFTVMIDAQRDEFYVSDWNASTEKLAGNPQPISPLRLASLAEVEQRAAAGETLVGPDANSWFPTARNVNPSAVMLTNLACKRTDYKNSNPSTSAKPPS